MSDLTQVLVALGAVTLLAATWGWVANVYWWVRGAQEKAVQKHRYKHRFDRPPTAGCYCVDCVNWHKDKNICDVCGGWPSPENGFCWLAEPKASDQAEAEEEGPENQR